MVQDAHTVLDTVAPLVGAWIETSRGCDANRSSRVAPLVGAWIETAPNGATKKPMPVAPLVGAWIETYLTTLNVP